MHANARAVTDAARIAGLSIEPREFPDGTRTAAEAADAVGTDVARIVKSLVFTVDGEPVVALVSGADQLDPDALAAAAGGRVATRADADTVRAATGFPIGGVPPFGHAGDLRVFVDRSLLAHPTVWAAAGTPRHSFEVGVDDLVRVSGGVLADLARRPPGAAGPTT